MAAPPRALTIRESQRAAIGELIRSAQAMNFDAIPWTLIKGQKEGEIVLLRRRDFATGFPKSDFPHRLNIFWQMSEPAPSGLPESPESERMKTFEDRLVEATEPDEQAILSMVVTGKGQREYVFHTRDQQEFLRRLTDMPQEADAYPIELFHTDDETWEYVNRVNSDFAIE